MEMLMKPQLCVSSNATDDYLRYLRQMNISHCFVMFRNEETNYDAVNRTLERVRAAGLTVDDAGNGFLYKHPSIQLGLPDRDEWIAKYNDLNRWLGNAGVKVGYATWDTGRVSTSWWKAGEHTHGAMGRIVDMNEIYARKPAFGQEYDYDTMWNNFEYFLRAALPSRTRLYEYHRRTGAGGTGREFSDLPLPQPGDPRGARRRSASGGEYGQRASARHRPGL